jgi:hypothetical protein
MLGVKNFRCALIVLARINLMHLIAKGQDEVRSRNSSIRC